MPTRVLSIIVYFSKHRTQLLSVKKQSPTPSKNYNHHHKKENLNINSFYFLFPSLSFHSELVIQ